MKRAAWALVPAKCFTRGKSRLSPILDDTARAAFARSLLEHVLGVLRDSGLFRGVVVATDCEEVEEVAARHGALVLRDADPAPLATVIDRALADLERRGAARALVLMADLPHLGADDVREVVAALDTHDLAIVRAVDGTHTNALALAPPTRMPTCFGRADSFAAHCRAAREAGLRVAVIENERIAFDVDEPAEHAALAGRGPARST